jgi:hypothetical protein
MKAKRNAYKNGEATLQRKWWPFRCDVCPNEPCQLRLYFVGTSPPMSPHRCPVTGAAEWQPDGWRYEDYED